MDNYDYAHIHILLNHFPTVGNVVALALFIGSLIWRSDDVRRASLVAFVGLALITIPAYVTGNAAQQPLQRAVPDVTQAAIESHEGVAMLALITVELTGILAWLALWNCRRRSRWSTPLIVAVLIVGVIGFTIAARAATLGGEIRHSEIRASAAIPAGHLARDVSSFILSLPWGWAACESVHFVGLCMLFTVVLILDLRMLGLMKAVSFQSLHRLLPWGVLGFAMNTFTGMAFFIASPDQYTYNVSFYWKLAFILLGGANALYFTVLDQAWNVGPGDEAPLAAKVFAGSTIFAWAAVVYCGSMLPFIGNAF